MCILLGALTLATIPARGQIVSYMDSNGKRVFVNADPAPAPKVTKASIRGFSSASGSKPFTTQMAPMARLP